VRRKAKKLRLAAAARVLAEPITNRTLSALGGLTNDSSITMAALPKK
jgi:hypothetical protein